MNVALDQKYYSPAEVQKLYSISRATLYNMLSDGRLEGIKVGRSTRIPAESIAAYFHSCPKFSGGEMIGSK
ncbi:helix-turn-helix domain-containing protein [Acetobacteraceae bacterium]|nr:helix-turn-helix domain-containing protein [Acetobacteraceae bacterium]